MHLVGYATMIQEKEKIHGKLFFRGINMQGHVLLELLNSVCVYSVYPYVLSEHLGSLFVLIWIEWKLV